MTELRALMDEITRWTPEQRGFIGSDQISQLQDEFNVLTEERARLTEALRAARTLSGETQGFSDEAKLFSTLPASPPPRHLENRVPAQIAERASIAAASRAGQFVHFRVVTPSSLRREWTPLLAGPWRASAPSAPGRPLETKDGD